MGDVVEEGVADSQSIGRAHRGCQVALQEGAIQQHQLGQTVGARDEVAVEIRQQHGHIAHIGIGEVDSEQGSGLSLHLSPVRDGSGNGAIEELAGGAQAPSLNGVGLDEHLVGGMGCIGLVLVNPGGDRVVVRAGVIRSA